MFFFFFQAEDGIRDYKVTGVQTCALPISALAPAGRLRSADFAAEGRLREGGPREEDSSLPEGEIAGRRRSGSVRVRSFFAGRQLPQWEEKPDGRQESRLEEVRQEDRPQAERRVHEGHAAEPGAREDRGRQAAASDRTGEETLAVRDEEQPAGQEGEAEHQCGRAAPRGVRGKEDRLDVRNDEAGER